MFAEVLEEEIREEIRKLKLQDKVVVDKLWGWELWLENNERYCGKLLYIMPGFQSSLHYHKQKDETFIALAGVTALEVLENYGSEYSFDNTTTIFNLELLRPWAHDSCRLMPGTPHRFFSMYNEPSIVMEVSTRHDDRDVVRLEDSRKIYVG